MAFSHVALRAGRDCVRINCSLLGVVGIVGKGFGRDELSSTCCIAIHEEFLSVFFVAWWLVERASRRWVGALVGGSGGVVCGGGRPAAALHGDDVSGLLPCCCVQDACLAPRCFVSGAMSAGKGIVRGVGLCARTALLGLRVPGVVTGGVIVSCSALPGL